MKKPRKRRWPRFFALLLVLVAAAYLAFSGQGLHVSGLLPWRAGAQDMRVPLKSAGPKAMSGGEQAPPLAAGPGAEASRPAPRGGWELVLVSADKPLDHSFRVDLKRVPGGYFVDARIAAPLSELMAQAKREGAPLAVTSAYRSVHYQSKLFERKTTQLRTGGRSLQKAQDLAARLVARPGQSEHHTGLALDFIVPHKPVLDESFALTPQGQWLERNAWRYGFILRFPKGKEQITGISFEPWHFRYVGGQAAEAMFSSGQCLEEYLQAAPGGEARILEE